jgi:hypothetical protein
MNDSESTGETVHRGVCMCGAVRYEGTGTVKNLCYCHCTSCRRASGVPAVPWGTFTSDRFTVTKGTLTEYRSSAEAVRGFCATCGTSLTYRNTARPAEVDVTLATLDDANQLAPRAHIWAEDKLAWEHLGDGLPQFATVPGAAKP